MRGKPAYYFSFLMMIVQPDTFAQIARLTTLKEYQITFGAKGHTLNYTQCFSPDNKWLVYDSRNEGTLIGSSCCIERVNISSKEIVKVYETPRQSEYGPGVGAAAYNPFRPQVIFIHGLMNSDSFRPYGFTRRTGVMVNDLALLQPVFMDARDITPPFTPGALRGGTHAHSWSGDGQWISFTYNDFIVQQLQDSGTAIKDLRTIGVMAPLKKVSVQKNASGENNDGEYFTVVIAKVVDNPQPGSDDIEKAYDEGWIGKDGYITIAGNRQKRAIAFQGNTLDKEGKLVTEVFVADIPEDITIVKNGEALEGSATRRPDPPAGSLQKRITFTNGNKHPGIQGPRHWLRSSPDGSDIYFLMKDDNGIVQVFSIPAIGGKTRQITQNEFSVQSGFSISPDGQSVAYAADNSVFISAIHQGNTQRVTKRFAEDERPEGGMVWSYDGKMIAYNRYVVSEGQKWLQIFVLR